MFSAPGSNHAGIANLLLRTVEHFSDSPDLVVVSCAAIVQASKASGKCTDTFGRQTTIVRFISAIVE